MVKRFFACLALCVLLLTACGNQSKQPTEVIVFAAASLQESLDAAIDAYQEITPDILIVPTYDSSGTLEHQIRQGAPCDLFLSAAHKQMDELEADGLILSGSRLDLLENAVVLAVPNGNPAGIESFEHLAACLSEGSVLLAIGNSDVPVGQYTQEIFAYFDIDERVVSSCLTYGSNVREVTTQASEGAVDCAVIYATDAFSSGLTVTDRAVGKMCSRVIYPAAVLSSGSETAAAQAFLDFLTTDEALACFEAVGFSPLP